MNMLLLFGFLLIFVISANQVLAYVDPGTSGIVVGSAWPMVLAILGAVAGFFAKIFYKPIKNKVLKLKKKMICAKGGN